MSPAQIFEFCNTAILPAWLLLIIAPYWKWTSRIVIGFVVTFMSILYAYFVFQAFGGGDFGSFGSLEGVMTLFQDEKAVLVGWLHYLAFDLMVGWFIVFDAKRSGVNRYIIIPCLLLSLMLGPTGLLLYLLIRWGITKKYFVDIE